MNNFSFMPRIEVPLITFTINGNPVNADRVEFISSSTDGAIVAVENFGKVTANGTDYFAYKLSCDALAEGYLRVQSGSNVYRFPTFCQLDRIGLYGEPTASIDALKNRIQFVSGTEKYYIAMLDGFEIESLEETGGQNPGAVDIVISSDKSYAEIKVDIDKLNGEFSYIQLEGSFLRGSDRFTFRRHYDIQAPIKNFDNLADGHFYVNRTTPLTENEMTYTISSNNEGGIIHSYNLTVKVKRGDENRWLNAYQFGELALEYGFTKPEGAVKFVDLKGNGPDFEDILDKLVENGKTIDASNQMLRPAYDVFAVVNESESSSLLTPADKDSFKLYIYWLDKDDNIICFDKVFYNVVADEDFDFIKFEIVDRGYPEKSRVILDSGSNVNMDYSEAEGLITFSPKTGFDADLSGEAPDGFWKAVKIAAPDGYIAPDGADFQYLWLSVYGMEPKLSNVFLAESRIRWNSVTGADSFAERINIKVENVLPGYGKFWDPMNAAFMPVSNDSVKVEYSQETGLFHIGFPGSTVPSVADILKIQDLNIAIPENAAYFKYNSHGGPNQHLNSTIAQEQKNILDAIKLEPADTFGCEPIFRPATLLIDDITVYYNPRPNDFDGRIIEWYDAEEKLIGTAFIYGDIEDLIKEVITESVEEVTEPVDAPTIEFKNNKNHDMVRLKTKFHPQEGNNGFIELEKIGGSRDDNNPYVVYLPYSLIGAIDMADAMEKYPTPPSIKHYDNEFHLKEVLEASYTEFGIVFETTSFSPFTIILDQPEEEPGQDDGESNTTDPVQPTSPSKPSSGTAKPDASEVINTDTVLSSEGIAETTVNAADVSKAVESLLRADENVDAVTVVANVKGDAENVKVSVPAGALKMITDNTSAGLDVLTPNGKVSMSADTLAAVVKQVGNASNIEFSVAAGDILDVKAIVEDQADELLEKAVKPFDAKTLDDAVVADITIRANDKIIHTFGGKKLAVEIPVNEAIFNNNKYYRAFIVSADGTVEHMVVKISNGKALAATKHLSSIVVTTEECTPFIDVELGQWYTNDVIYVFENNIMNGVGDGLFGKTAAVTRAMFVTMLYNLSGRPSEAGLENHFADVEAGQWYEDAVKWAYANGIVAGVDASHFAPGKAITRESLITMLYNYAKISGKTAGSSASIAGFADADTVSSWASEALKWAYAENLIAGSNNKLMPRSDASRVEGAAFFTRFMKNIM
ncbi:MAG: S-layer homology domain-containing protein [Clostridia bacterium]|nr:S-layer homology domain-containing protein [Clostridia bacterium]